MKFFAVIFLATLSYIGDEERTENLYSYQLQFGSYDECIHFYNNNSANLLNGLLEHGKEKYGDIQIEYLSCAEVEITPTLSVPNVIGQKPIYKRGNR